MLKKPLIPDYLYSARVSEDDIPYFEDLYYEQVEFYPEDVKETELRFDYARRMGYVWMKQLETRVDPYLNSKSILLGDENYQWSLSVNLLRSNPKPLAICAGAGTNISFEQELAAQFSNADVFLLDPSPQAIDHVNRQELPNNLTFLEKGLSGEDDVLRFHKPSLQGIGSLSALNLNPSEEFFDLPVLSVGTVMDEIGAVGREIDYLKFDIEGSEHGVVDNLVETKTFPAQVAFELDQPVPPWKMEQTVRKLLLNGYALAKVWGLNVHFIRKDCLDAI